MCITCGCSHEPTTVTGHHTHEDGTFHPDHDHVHGHHDHDHDHDSHGNDAPHQHTPAQTHSHAPGVAPGRIVQIEQDILSKNNAYAAANRQTLARQGIFALNLVSSPGAGKTTLLCKTIAQLRLGTQALPVAVIEGDQQTSQDADRIRATGAPAVQINTGKGCHLDAHAVGHAIHDLQPSVGSLLMIENVGNLVCPAAFDLGEDHKVVVLSVTEGEDKPIKYPDMFRAASLMIINKIDLLPHLDYDVNAAIAYARRVHPDIRVIQLSATSGAGMDEWLAYLQDGVARAKATAQASSSINLIYK